jgi:superfamily I DNA and/or RNA helicase
MGSSITCRRQAGSSRWPTQPSPNARQLVLVGDQMQLAQPLQGTHPGESGQSALDYLLNGHATIPPDFGVFLNETRRLHPDICGFISEAVYEGRLHAHPDTARHRVLVPPKARGHIQGRRNVFVRSTTKDSARTARRRSMPSRRSWQSCWAARLSIRTAAPAN